MNFKKLFFQEKLCNFWDFELSYFFPKVQLTFVLLQLVGGNEREMTSTIWTRVKMRGNERQKSENVRNERINENKKIVLVIKDVYLFLHRYVRKLIILIERVERHKERLDKSLKVNE